MYTTNNVYLHDKAAGGGVAPIVGVLQAEDDVLGLLHLGLDHGLHLLLRRLQGAVATPRRGLDQPWRVDDRQVGTVLVLHADDDLLGPKLALAFEARIFVFDILLCGWMSMTT